MTHHVLTTPTKADAASLARRLRDADRAEIAASCGLPPEAVLQMAVAGQGPAWSIKRDPADLPLAMFGVDPVAMNPHLGIVWMLGTDELFQRYPTTFLRHCRQAVEMLHQHHPLLGNYVDARNTVHLRWLQWLGFSFLRLLPEYGVERRPFIQFARLQTPCVQ